MLRVHWSDREGHALSSFQRGAHDSDVHDQISNGTCYAFTVATLIRDAQIRLGLGATEHTTIRKRVVAQFGGDGAEVRSALEWALKDVGLWSTGARVQQLSLAEARDVVRKKRGKVAVGFDLDDTQWAAFAAFYEEQPAGFLSAHDLGFAHGELSGHVTVLEDQTVPPGSGADPDQFLQLKNSWGAEFASAGFFLVADCAAQQMSLELLRVDLSSDGRRPIDEEFAPTDLTKDVEWHKGTFGEGSFGVIRSGRLRSSGDEVAIKVCKNGHDKTLEGEIATLLAVHEQASSRHLCKVLGVAMDDHDCWALVMPKYVRNLGSENAVTADRIPAVLTGIALALRIVHAAGLIHMDVKESNILINDAKEAVLCDFGCAIRQDMQPKPRRRGTAMYRAPEARSTSYDERVDVYSLGKVVGAMKDRLNDQSLHETLEELSRELTHPDPERRKSLIYVIVTLRAARPPASAPLRGLRTKHVENAGYTLSQPSDSETRTAAAQRKRVRPLDTDLPPPMKKVAAEFMVYLCSQTYHHRECSRIKLVEDETGKVTKRVNGCRPHAIPWADICDRSFYKPCHSCKHKFNFTAVGGGKARPAPAPCAPKEEISLPRWSDDNLKKIEAGYEKHREECAPQAKRTQAPCPPEARHPLLACRHDERAHSRSGPAGAGGEGPRLVHQGPHRHRHLEEVQQDARHLL